MNRQRIRDTVFMFALNATHKIDIVKHWQSLSIPEATPQTFGFKGTHQNCFLFHFNVSVLCQFDDVCQQIRQDLDIYWNIDHQKEKKLKKKQRRK